MNINADRFALFLSGIKGIVFDCDGVMLDSFESNKLYYNLFKADCGLSPMTEEEEKYVHAHTVVESLKYILPEELHPSIDERRRKIEYKRILPHLKVEPGLTDFLSLLHTRGYRMAVNTNRTNTMDAVVDQFGWRQYFNPVVTAAKVANPKPHPESLNLILNRWGYRPEEIIFIGDTSVDERAAKGANVQFWAYKNKNLDAAFHIDDFPSLRGLFVNTDAFPPTTGS